MGCLNKANDGPIFRGTIICRKMSGSCTILVDFRLNNSGERLSDSIYVNDTNAPFLTVVLNNRPRAETPSEKI